MHLRVPNSFQDLTATYQREGVALAEEAGGYATREAASSDFFA